MLKSRYFCGGSILAVAMAISATSAAAQSSGPSTVEEVIVTGSFIAGTPENSAMPVDVLSSQDLEKQGWIATAECHEIRVSLDDEDRMEYAVAPQGEKYRFASANRKKLGVLSMLASKHREDSVLIIGQYLDQLDAIAKRIEAPLITGDTPVRQREILYQQFREGKINRLILSRVGNFSIDLPDANVLIQMSGMFGSRQEEAQRLGRVLRPKANGLLAHFYSIVTRDTLDQEYAAKR